MEDELKTVQPSPAGDAPIETPEGEDAIQKVSIFGNGGKPNASKRLVRNAFLITLIALAVVLVAYGILRSRFGPFLSVAFDKNFPNIVIISAVGIMLWNRKILKDEKKAAAAQKLEDEEAAAAKRIEDEGE
jgi:hypothetical protein